MATVIYDALSELLEDEFKEFKWHLSNSDTKDNSIARGKLEDKNRHEVVDLIMQQYGSSDARKVAIRVLRKIKQNDLADQLKGKLQEVSEDVSAEGGAPSGAAAAKNSVVTVSLNSSSGGTVKAPVIQGSVIHGPMTFN